MDEAKKGQKIKVIDKDGKIWIFSNVVSIDICFEKNWCNICYYGANNKYHEEVGDIPESINFGIKEE